MTELLVSVIVPVRNGSESLRSTINGSLREVADAGGGEVVAVEDGSEDDSLRILEQFGARVTLARTSRHRGRNSARNLGLGLAKGKYVKFLDQDDDLEKGSLFEELGLATRAGADIVVSGHREASHGEVGKIVEPPRFEAGIDSLLAGASVPTAAAIYRREYLDDLRWDDLGGKLDDWLFFLRAALKGGSIARRIGAAYTWRRHASQESNRVPALAIAQDFYRILDWLEDELLSRGELSRQRRLRLAQYRYKELRLLCRLDRERFEEEVKRILALDADFTPRDEERRLSMKLVSRVVGFRRANLMLTRIKVIAGRR